MVAQLLERIETMGVSVNQHAGVRGDCLELIYGDVTWVQNINGYNEPYQMKMILDSPVMEKVFR